MAITGNNTLSVRKRDLANQKSIATGFKKTVFAHKASAGETGISVGDLVVPTELSGAGFTNPSFNEIAGAKMKLYRKNVRITSSAKGVLMDYLSYNIVSSTQINWVGFTAEEGEIFTVEIDHNARTGLRVVDAAPLVASGILAAGIQDFSAGMPFEVNKFPNAQVGAVTVYVDGAIQYRNSGNATADPGADGNYQEVDAGSGVGTIIRFNTTEAYDRNIIVISTGLLVEKPNEAQLAEVERVQGQVDKLVETVAVLAGVPETDFQAAPNQVDLKQFGDRVLDLEQIKAEFQADNAWTAPQSLVGITDGSSKGAGQIGERIEVSSPAVGSTSTINVFSVIGTIVLTPGVWEIQGRMTYTAIGSTLTGAANCAAVVTSKIRNSSDSTDIAYAWHQHFANTNIQSSIISISSGNIRTIFTNTVTKTITYEYGYFGSSFAGYSAATGGGTVDCRTDVASMFRFTAIRIA